MYLVLFVGDLDRYDSVAGPLVLHDPLHALLHELQLRWTLGLKRLNSQPVNMQSTNTTSIGRQGQRKKKKTKQGETPGGGSNSRRCEQHHGGIRCSPQDAGETRKDDCGANAAHLPCVGLARTDDDEIAAVLQHSAHRNGQRRGQACNTSSAREQRRKNTNQRRLSHNTCHPAKTTDAMVARSIIESPAFRLSRPSPAQSG